MPRRLLPIIAITLILASTVLAQVGKISGTVTDKQTKEPMVGATIQLLGTTFGAASGVDGRYNVLNVPPGTYNVRVTYVGYQDVTVNNVTVTTGLTQELNFQLSSTAVEVQPVIIIGERPLIEKSATNAIRISKAEDIQNLPVRGTTDVVALQPGVVLQNDRIFIRGSRPSDVGYQIEGANTTNIIGGRLTTGDESGGSFVGTIPEAVEEVLVQAGGYTAEFGNANAGIVSSNLKTGRDRYHFSLQGETDNLASQGSQFLGTYSYGYSDYVLTASGPTISDKIRFFFAGENRFQRDYTPTFWEGANFGVMKDNGSRGGDTTQSADVNWIAGNIPGRSSGRYSMDGTLLFDYKPLLVKTSAVYSWQRNRANGITNDIRVPQIIPVQEIFNMGRLPQVDQSNLLLTAKGTYFFASNVFSELNFSMLDDRFKTYDPNFDDNNLLLAGDSVQAAMRGWTYKSYSDPARPYDFYGFPFDRPGAPLVGFQKRQNTYWGLNGNVTSQSGRHELKAGASYQYYTVRNYGGIGAAEIPQLLTAIRARPDEVSTPEGLARVIRRETFVDNYGYDEFGRPIDSGPDRPKHPKFAAVFLQDKVEFSDLIINAGLRFDYLDMDTWLVTNPNNPGFDPTEYTLSDTALKSGRTFTYLQPRLGFSFPVTDRTVFHMQYGEFVQAPPLYTAYRGRAAAALIYQNQFYITNPLATDIEPTRTTQYELGFTQQFADFASFDVTGFYKDIKGQLQNDLFIVDRRIAAVQNYPIYTNADFATTKGFEFRLNVRRINRIQAQLNYTLSDARGTNSFPASAAAAITVTQGQVRPTAITPLGFDQTHRGTVNLDYRFGPQDGGPVFRNFGANLLFSFNSGHRFTRATGGGGQQGPETGAILNDVDARSRSPLEPINTSTTPWNFQLDLRLDKTFPVGGLGLNIYGYIQNLLNTKNVINVYYRTGNAFDDAYLSSPNLSSKVVAGLGSNYVDMYRVINLEDRQHQWSLNGVDLFSSPRQIRIGARLEF